MKRRLLILAVFLLAGAVVNVAVAWGCCLFGPFTFDLSDVSPSEAEWLWAQFPTDQECVGLGFKGIHRGFGYQRCTVFFRVEDGRPGDATTGVRTNTGWPCFALTSSHFARMQIVDPATMKNDQFREIESKSFGLIKLPALISTHRGNTTLPTEVLWPGFLINTALYGAIICLPVVSVMLWRRMRVRRGLCPKCGYPVGDSAVCTECGEPLPGLR